MVLGLLIFFFTMLARVLLLLGLSLSFCRSSARASAPRPIVRVLGEDDFFEVTSKGNYLVEFVKREEGDGRVHLNSEVIAEVAGVLKEEHGCLLATVDCDLHWRVCGQFPFLDAFPSLKLIKDRRVVEFRDYHGWLADMGDDVEQPSTLGEMLIHFVHGGTERAALIARPLPAKRTLLDDVLVQLMDNGPFSAKVWFADIKVRAQRARPGGADRQIGGGWEPCVGAWGRVLGRPCGGEGRWLYTSRNVG